MATKFLTPKMYEDLEKENVALRKENKVLRAKLEGQVAENVVLENSRTTSVKEGE